MEDGYERFKVCTKAEAISTGVGGFAGFVIGISTRADHIRPQRIEASEAGAEAEKLRSEIQIVKDLKGDLPSAPSEVHPGAGKFLAQAIKQKRQEVKTLEEVRPPEFFTAESVGILSGGASLTALMLATLTCAVRRRAHKKIFNRKVKEESEAIIADFEEYFRRKL